MKYKIFFLLILVFNIIFSSVFSTEMVEASFSISDINKIPLENVSVKIGDLIIKTDRNGVAKCLLFPASYEISIEKLNFYSQTSQFEISASNNQFSFEMVSKLTPVTFKLFDSFSNLPVAGNIKLTNQNNLQNLIITADQNGTVTASLEKKSVYTINVTENSYKPIKMTIDTNNLAASSVSLALTREEFGVKIKSNSNSGNYTIKSLENSSVFTGSFTGQVLALLLPFGKYEFTIGAENYKSVTKTINITSSYEDSIKMIPSFKNFNFFLKIGDKNNFEQSSEKPLNYLPVRNFKVTLLKNSKIEIPLKLSENTSSVPFGVYDVVATSDFSERLFFQNVLFDENSLENIIFTAKESYSFVSGTISTSGSLLGGVEILFTDENDNSYSAVTSIEGSYSLKLPPRNYTVSIIKDGYRPVKNSILTLDKMSSNGNYTVNLNLEEIPSVITGKVTTSTGNPVANAKITVKLEKTESIFYTEEDGSYKIYSPSGLLMIKVEKQGIKTKGIVKMLNRFSTITGVDFKVDEVLSSIEGSITDGSLPLGNIQVQLFTGDKLVTSLISRNDGGFYFENLSSYKKYSIVIENVNYIKYKSQSIDLTAVPLKNFNIILNKNILNAVLEFRDSSNKPLSNSEIVVNNTTYKTDINGFLELPLKISEEITMVTVSIPAFNFNDSFEIPKDSKSFKKSIVIK